jgi:HTH-type transcriptional regulator / antitoxin HipB
MAKPPDPLANLNERAARSRDLAMAMRARRERLGLRQAELAELAGVSERFVHALESAKPTVQLDKLLDVLAALGLHLELARGAVPAIGTTSAGVHVDVDGAS